MLSVALCQVQPLNTFQRGSFHNCCLHTTARPQPKAHCLLQPQSPCSIRQAPCPRPDVRRHEPRPTTRSSAGNRKLRCTGHVRRMDWSRLPRKFFTSCVDAPRSRGRAHSHVHDLTHELQRRNRNRRQFNLSKAADRCALGAAWHLDLQSWGAADSDRDTWRKLVTPVRTKPISEQARMDQTQSEHPLLRRG
jgi:hypothetical protein